MYNLIVTGEAGAWDGNSYEFQRERVAREHTDETITERYKILNDHTIKELQSFPTLFAYERHLNTDARIGFLQRIGSRSGKVRLQFQVDSILPLIPASQLANLTWELDIDKYEMNRSHWAVKTVDLFPVLINAKLITKKQLAHLSGSLTKPPPLGMSSQLVITPTAFRIPTQQLETDLVSVMMPFDAAFKQTYASIQRACKDASLRCLRVDDIWQESVVVQEVFNLLVRSSIVVVDFSGRNPNVMYETGIAHTLGRSVIPISQSLDDVPFDLRHHRVLKYLPNTEGRAEMQIALTERLKTLIQCTTPQN